MQFVYSTHLTALCVLSFTLFCWRCTPFLRPCKRLSASSSKGEGSSSTRREKRQRKGGEQRMFSSSSLGSTQRHPPAYIKFHANRWVILLETQLYFLWIKLAHCWKILCHLFQNTCEDSIHLTRRQHKGKMRKRNLILFQLFSGFPYFIFGHGFFIMLL